MSTPERRQHNRRSRPDDTIVHDPQRRRSVLAAVCIALTAIIAAVTCLNVAPPRRALDAGAPQSQVLWMINIHAISLASLLLPLGAAGEPRQTEGKMS